MIYKRTTETPGGKLTVQRKTSTRPIELYTTSGYEALTEREALRLAEMLLAACNTGH